MIFKKFWQWYDRNYALNVGFVAGLFLLQIILLVWLFGEVVAAKLFGTPLFAFHDAPKIFIILVDYTEIPAIFAIPAVYVNELRKEWNFKSFLYLILLHLQWLHLFWITDEFVIESFIHNAPLLFPVWLAWVAILIDYLELPVIFDTIGKFFKSLKKENFKNALLKLKED